MNTSIIVVGSILLGSVILLNVHLNKVKSPVKETKIAESRITESKNILNSGSIKPSDGTFFDIQFGGRKKKTKRKKNI